MTGLFQKLFGHSKSPSQEAASAPASSEPVLTSPDLAEEGSADLEQFLAGCAQSVGKQREHNEDALFALTSTLGSGAFDFPFGLFVVADGMGGHKHGEIASGVAVRTMSSYVLRHLYEPLLNFASPSEIEPIQETLRAAIQEAHRAILKEAPGGGTTLTAALILGEQMIIAHVGDSRAYSLSPQGELKILTRDHSLVKRLVELGQITNEEAAVHPQRNVLYRALGQGEPFEPDMTTTPLPRSGYLLLCSDGLWGVVQEHELIEMIASSASPRQACQRMVAAANAAGGPDNITAILVRMPD